MKGPKIRRRKISAPGCDDAPVATVPRGPDPKKITFIYPYYENPEMLSFQAEMWGHLPAQHLRFIVVDDGSPNHPAEKILVWYRSPLLELYRIGVDVRWNWLAARNIGMFNARTEWCLLTDMDHMVTQDVADELIYGQHDPNIIYRFSRCEADGTPVHPHPNSWFMTREMFWRIGGYDEALSGYYGTDGEYRRRAAATAPIRILVDKLHRYEFYLDSSTTLYERKQPEDAAVQRLIAARGPDWKPKVLSFPWTRVL